MWSPQLIPGPLQSEEYARAVMRALRPDLDDEAIDAEVQVRLKRGRLLRQRGGLRGWFVMGESAVRCPVGGPQQMRRALQHLLKVVDGNPRVQVQILPIDAGEHAGMEGGISILEFELPAPTIAHVEYPSGAAWLEKPSDIERATLTFDHVLAAALDPQVSIGCIEQLVREMGEVDGSQ